MWEAARHDVALHRWSARTNCCIQWEERALLLQRHDSVDREGYQAPGMLLFGIGVAAVLAWRSSAHRRNAFSVSFEV